MGEGGIRPTLTRAHKKGTRKSEVEGEPMEEQKKLENGSQYEHYDKDGDGVVTDEEFEMEQRMMRMENEDKREDAQRNMAWFALAGMLLYPLAVVLAIFAGLDKAGQILGDMAATYFVSVAAIVAAFYGKEAYAKGKAASPPAKK